MARKLGRTNDQDHSTHQRKEPVSTEHTSDGKSLYSRRSYLTLSASVAAVLQSSTVATAHSSRIERDGIEFQYVRDAVDDLGMDPTGREPVDSALAAAEDGVLIQFPDGRYQFDADEDGVELAAQTRGFEAVGEDVTFVVPEGYRGFSLSCDRMDGIYVDGIDLDQTAPDSYTGVRLRGTRVVVRDVELRGGCDVRGGGCPVISHATLAPNGTSQFENVAATAGNQVRPMLGRPGIFIEESHAGVVRIRDCDFREFPDAAVHATGHPGTVAVLDSYFENNASSIRLGGSGGTVERCEVVVDETPVPLSTGGDGHYSDGSRQHPSGDRQHPAGDGQQFRRHGIAVMEGVTSTSPAGQSPPVTITDTSIRIENEPLSGPAIVVPSSGSPLEVVDCDVEYNNDDSAVILCRRPGVQSGPPVRPLRVRGTTIAGSGTMDAAVVLGNVEEGELHDTSILLPGASEDVRRLESECDASINGLNSQR